MSPPGAGEQRHGRSGPAAACLAVLLALLGGFAPPIIVGDRVLTPLIFQAVAVSAAVLTMVRVGRRTGSPRRVVQIWVGLLCLCLVGVHLMWTMVQATSYHLLKPIGPGGCRVVVRESSFLMAGGGEVGVVGRWGGPAPMIARYSVDDGGRPIEHGDYTLTWGADGSASLYISAAYDGPGEPPLSC